MRKYALPIILIIAGSLLLSACNALEPKPTPSAAEQAEQVVERVELMGTLWEAQSFGEVDAGIDVLPDTKLTLNLAGERYAGYDGCNWFSGVYESKAPQLTFYMPAQTSFMCDDADVSAQSATYFSSLINTTAYEIEGENLVTYTEGNQRMATFVPATAIDMEGTPWTVKFVNDGTQMTPASEYEFDVTALFKDGSLTGMIGCNDYSAEYVVDGDSITFSNILSENTDCEEYTGAPDVATWYLDSLEQTTNFTPLSATMIFTDVDGQDTVFFGTP